MPVTCRLELLDRSPDGDLAQAYSTLSGSSTLQLTGMNLGLTLLFSVLMVFVFRCRNYRTNERGNLDTFILSSSGVNIAEP